VSDVVRNIEAMREEALAEATAVTTLEGLEHARIRYLGRKGKLTAVLRSIRDVSEDERPLVGNLANSVKVQLDELLQKRREEILAAGDVEKDGTREADLSLPGERRWLATLHPITLMFDEIVEIFFSMGFSVERGPEVEDEYYNFTSLNFPPDHPALDMQATFFMGDGIVLRTHTSPVQIRTFLKEKPPVRVIAPGRCFRSDKIDASHFPVFHQVEGFFVDTDVTFADLKATLIEFAKKMFGNELEARFRPSFFPFTEPSAEMDISCLFCRGKGCRVCKSTGWIEILGSGMIDPAVFEAVQYDAEAWTGFAFGMGVERIAMLKYGIGDIRFFYENDLKFLEQFL
jgi:phenylalanyl-tRNA synthetase alpha chain